MADWIHECNNRFGPAPRTHSWWHRLTYLRVPQPTWLRQDRSDKLMTMFHHFPSLFRDGVVVWAHVIQANALMFQPGVENCPGEVVYSLLDSEMTDPEYLQELAHALYSLKGTRPDNPELAPIAHYLTDQWIRVFGLPVPSAVSPTVRCQISTTLFVRKHLPQQRLCCPLLPMVVHPHEPFVATVLPERYWPPELVEVWVSLGGSA